MPLDIIIVGAPAPVALDAALSADPRVAQCKRSLVELRDLDGLSDRRDRPSLVVLTSVALDLQPMLRLDEELRKGSVVYYSDRFIDMIIVELISALPATSAAERLVAACEPERLVLVPSTELPDAEPEFCEQALAVVEMELSRRIGDIPVSVVRTRDADDWSTVAERCVAMLTPAAPRS